MKRNILILFCVVTTVLSLTALTWDTRTSYEVFASSYTCEPTPRNPMHPCGPLRWGGNVNAPGMACPVTWRDRVMEVPGFGRLRCDDTPAQDYLYGLPHIDIRVSTVNQALQIGVQRMVIYSVDTVAPAPTPVPQPVIETTNNNVEQTNVSAVRTPEAMTESKDLVVVSETDTLVNQSEVIGAASSAENNGSSQPQGQANTVGLSHYTVRPNDTLSGIALEYNTTVNEFRTLNQIRGDLIIIDQQLILPTNQSEQVVAKPVPTLSPEPILAPAPELASPSEPESIVSQQIHTVQQGEWLYAIARRYGVAPDLLLRTNNLSNPNFIYPGQELIIPNQ